MNAVHESSRFCSVSLDVSVFYFSTDVLHISPIRIIPYDFYSVHFVIWGLLS